MGLMNLIGDSALILIAQRNEDKRLKKGEETNKNLSPAIQTKVKDLKTLANENNASAAYNLGCMYINGDEVGYNPTLAVKYFTIAAKQHHFHANYSLALYYKGYWSYFHKNNYKSYTYYLNASKCNCNDAEYMAAVKRVLNKEVHINNKEFDKNGNPMVWFVPDLPIK